MYCEGTLEPLALFLMEFDDTVVSYTTQPFSIFYQLNGRKTRYSPDILAKSIDGIFESIEVKPLNKLLQPKNVYKFNILSDLFPREVGHKLKVLTDEDINKGHRIANYQQLYPYRQEKLLVTDHEIITASPKSLTFDELVKLYSPFSESHFGSAMRLVAHGFFEWNEFERLCGSTLLIKKDA